MAAYRKEIGEFIRLAETLLSPVSLGQPLTEEECQIVEFCVGALVERYACPGGTLVNQPELVQENI